MNNFKLVHRIILCCLVGWLTACHFFSPIETVETHDEQGRLERYERRKKDFAKQGRYQKFYANGKVAIEALYENDTLQGERRFYYENGNIESTETYLHGVFHGPYRHYYESGKLALEQTYIDGMLQGLSKKYYPGGALADEVTMLNNEEEGPFVEYYESGVKKTEGFYTPGPDGPWEQGELKEYDETGKLVRTALCQDGRCHTK
jgi:antitoxin component YwqK of YwqJK toxin-antitoxin module